ncbi:MAG TPA: DNA-directed RNA polymerase subunit H [Thermoplasmata archaeon]|nr:DNA-directed RNA polymerase subunit H [Thermoplasmata archaeon]
MTPATPRTRSKKSSKSPSAPVQARPFVAHHMVPRHEVLSETESRKVLEDLGTPPERLPKILANDPGLKTDLAYVKARDARENLTGRLVRIRRQSETAGEAIAYRLIVPSSGGD